MWQASPPQDEFELLARCRCIEGLSVTQLAQRLSCAVPSHPLQRKGWVGTLVERALGTTAGHLALPDFDHLGIELKTVPMNARGTPAESTFVTSIPLLTIHQETWRTSACYRKLQRVLWIPIESSPALAFASRRFGTAVMWSPSVDELCVLERDWLLLTGMISRGQLADVDARMGDYLQVRPKAAHSAVLCEGLDEQGNRVPTLPRGFYLRSRFTATLLARVLV